MVTTHRRRWYNIGATKIPHADRDIAHGLLADPAVAFYDVIGADTDDDDPRFGVGADTTYSLHLTPEQADRASDASNLRYIEPDAELRPVAVPNTRTLTYMGAQFPSIGDWHARDVTVAILDQGTSAAVRNLNNWSLRSRFAFAGVPAGELHPDPTYGVQIHGCLTSSCAVPYGAYLLDGIVTSDQGTAPTSAIAAAIRWAGDNSADVINISFGGLYAEPLVIRDAFTYISIYDVEVYCSAGNDSLNSLSYPAANSRIFSYVNSVGAFDETTDALGSFSNWTADMTGVSPGVLVGGLMPDASERLWSGTSASAPHAVRLNASLQTNGRFTARGAGAALRSSLRDAGRGVRQGGGVFQLDRALAGYGAFATNHAMLSLI